MASSEKSLDLWHWRITKRSATYSWKGLHCIWVSCWFEYLLNWISITSLGPLRWKGHGNAKLSDIPASSADWYVRRVNTIAAQATNVTLKDRQDWDNIFQLKILTHVSCNQSFLDPRYYIYYILPWPRNCRQTSAASLFYSTQQDWKMYKTAVMIECWMILIQSCKIVNDKYKYDPYFDCFRG